jgi:hypothetical protein
MATNQGQRIGALEVDVNCIMARADRFDFELKDLVRKSQGITSANQRAAQLEQQFNQLQLEVSAIVERITRLGDAVGPAQEEHFKNLIGGVNLRLDSLWGDVNIVIESIQKDVSTLKLKTVIHQDRLDMHEQRLVSVEQSHRSTPWWVNALAALSGVVAGLVFHSIDFRQTLTFGEQSTTLVYKYANSWGMAVAFGVGFAVLVWLVFSFLGGESKFRTAATAGTSRVISQEKTTAVVAVETLPEPPVAVVVTPEPPEAQPNDTEVMPVYDQDADANLATDDWPKDLVVNLKQQEVSA